MNMCSCCTEELPDDETTVKVDENGVENPALKTSENLPEYKDLESMVTDL